MLNAWMLLVGLVGVIAMLIIAFTRAKSLKKKSTKKSFKPYANTAEIRNLPEYKSAKKKYHFVIIGVIAALFISIVSTVIIAARPVSVDIAKPDYENRDIMFCLDVSGSMTAYIKDMLLYYANSIVPKLQGQRLGFTIFDHTYLLLSPMTDDYEIFSDLLKNVAANTSDYLYALYSMAGGASSEIGFGLTGCVNNFDRLEEERSRDIILITDNYGPENPIVTLTAAGNFAKRHGIVIYGVSTSDSRSQQEIDNIKEGDYENASNKEFREVALATGGSYYALSRWSTEGEKSKEIANRIMEQSAARYEGVDTLVHTDVPLVPTIIATISLAVFIYLIWRLGL